MRHGAAPATLGITGWTVRAARASIGGATGRL
jgi:hypothetical protein